MSDLICVDCGQNVFMGAAEKVRFMELAKTVQGFQMPKRCYECRKARRMDRGTQAPGSSQTSYPPSRIAPMGVDIIERTQREQEEDVVPQKEEIKVLAPPPKSEVRLILAMTDFEDMVHGRPVEWQGVKVILADIGFKVMREAIDRAELERAKTLYHKNGASHGNGEVGS